MVRFHSTSPNPRHPKSPSRTLSLVRPGRYDEKVVFYKRLPIVLDNSIDIYKNFWRFRNVLGYKYRPSNNGWFKPGLRYRIYKFYKSLKVKSRGGGGWGGGGGNVFVIYEPTPFRFLVP